MCAANWKEEHVDLTIREFGWRCILRPGKYNLLCPSADRGAVPAGQKTAKEVIAASLTKQHGHFLNRNQTPEDNTSLNIR